MQRIVFLLLMCFSFLVSPAFANNTKIIKQSSHGACSPNAQVILISMVICLNRPPDAKQHQQLEAAIRLLEQIASSSKESRDEIRRNLALTQAMSVDKLASLLEYADSLRSKLSSIEPKLANIENAIVDMSRKLPAVWSASHEGRVYKLRGAVDLSHLKLSDRGKSLRAIVDDTGCDSLNYNPAFESVHYDLIKDIAGNDFIDCDEKQQYYHLIPVISSEQGEGLRRVFLGSRKTLTQLEEAMRCNSATSNFLESSSLERVASYGHGESPFYISDEHYRAAVELHVLGCRGAPTISESSPIKYLINSDPFVLSINPKRACALARLYSTKAFANENRRFQLLKIANERNPGDWDCFSDLVDYYAVHKDWLQVFELIRGVLSQDIMPELRSESDEDAEKKIIIYWRYLQAAAELMRLDNVEGIIIDGYNLTKRLFERRPSLYYLKKVNFFSGYLFRNRGAFHDWPDKAKYFSAVITSANKLRYHSIIIDTDYVSAMLDLSWYSLIGGAPEVAVKAVEAGLKVIEDSARVDVTLFGMIYDEEDLYANLICAYAMLNEKSKANDLYKYFSRESKGGKLWEEKVKEGFRKLENQGVVFRVNYDKLFF